MNIEMHGLEELTQVIRQYADADKITDSAVKEGAEYFKEALEDEVYRHGLVERTGKSETSMVIESEVKNGSIHVGVSNQKNDAFYLYFHEFGTSRMRARPFMRPAFETHQRNIIEKMAETLRRELKI